MGGLVVGERVRGGDGSSEVLGVKVKVDGKILYDVGDGDSDSPCSSGGGRGDCSGGTNRGSSRSGGSIGMEIMVELVVVEVAMVEEEKGVRDRMRVECVHGRDGGRTEGGMESQGHTTTTIISTPAARVVRGRGAVLT